ncbi:MAG: YwqG family protein [Prevotella sp.]|nr:YwqG family protein [Prevotella sp.]
MGFLLLCVVASSASDGSDLVAMIQLFSLIFGLVLITLSVESWKKYRQAWKQNGKAISDERHVAKKFPKWVQRFEHLTKTAAKLVRSNENRQIFSKFGGLPQVPADFKWPTCNNEPVPFLLQLDFAEINVNGQLKNFPTSGLLYVFVEEDATEDYHNLKILFFEPTENLALAHQPQNLSTIFREIYVAPELIKTYPAVEDCAEATQICDTESDKNLHRAYDVLCWKNMDSHLVGGWASYVQEGWFMREQDNPSDWVLLCQIASECSTNGEGDFMWGDAGTIYIYIREKDLIARNFDNVKLDMQCG